MQPKYPLIEILMFSGSFLLPGTGYPQETVKTLDGMIIAYAYKPGLGRPAGSIRQVKRSLMPSGFMICTGMFWNDARRIITTVTKVGRKMERHG